MKCAVVEYSSVHAEILPTLLHILNRMGIDVDLFASSRIIKNDPFVYTPGLKYRAGNSHGIGFKALVEARRFAGYDFVVFNSLEPKRVLRKAAAAKVPVLAVMHNGELIKKDPDYEAFFRDPRHKPLLLARSVSRFLSDSRPLPWFAPVLVADIPVQTPQPGEQVRFCVQGNLAFDRRNYASLLDAVESLVKSGFTGFVVCLIGRCRPDGRRFRSQAVRRGLEGFFEYAEQGIERYLEFAGRGIPYRKYYQFLAKSHFILPLVDRSSPAYESYYKGKITSSLSAAIGMGLIPVADRELAALYGVEDASITYTRGGLAGAMQCAIALGPDRHAAMRQRLREIRENLLKASSDNLAEAILGDPDRKFKEYA